MADTPLRLIRLSRGITLGEVASAVGLDKGSLSRLERGEVGASVESAERLVQFYVRGINELQILYPERYMKIEARRGVAWAPRASAGR